MKNFAIVDKLKAGKITNAKVLYSEEYKMIFPPPRYFDGTNFVSVLSAYDFKNLVVFWSNRGKVNHKIISISKRIKADDNPVLIFLRLKDK